jgi:VWFA-related protein
MTNQVQALENSLASSPCRTRARAVPRPRGGTLLYDAIVAASQVELGKERGRRAMVILTDGDDNGSRYNLEQAIAAAQRADVVVYSVSTAWRERFSEERLCGTARSTVAAASTAATSSTRSRTPPAATSSPSARRRRSTSSTPQIADDMRLQYQIGYTPPESEPGSYHKIELKPKAKHLTVQARSRLLHAEVEQSKASRRDKKEKSDKGDKDWRWSSRHPHLSDLHPF